MVLQEDGPRAALDFFNVIAYDWGVHTDELFITPFTFPIITKYNGESNVNNLGYEFLNQVRMEDAEAAFELNVRLFPNSSNAWDSYADCSLRRGDRTTALKSYRKSLELNPDNENARDMIEQLESR
jgi:tetratricopeptide (TPR) repeat protein